jgi:hypothetical protein
MGRTTLTLAAILAFAPAALSAQDSTAAGAEARVHATLQTALAAGIPVDLLERKVAEGKAKGVPMDRIAQAVDTRLQALTKARDAMASGGIEQPTEGDLSVAADAVQGGVSATALATISATAPQDRRAVAIAVLTDLVALGHASESALTQVQTALAHGPEALANLRGEAAGAAANAAGAANAGGIANAGGVGAQVSAGARAGVGSPHGK